MVLAPGYGDMVTRWHPWDGGPLIINPISTLYRVCISWVYHLLKGSLGGLKQHGYHQRIPAF